MIRLVTITFVLLFFSIACKAQSDYIAVLEDNRLRIDTTYWINVSNQTEYDTLNAWKKWKKVENFTFERDRGNIPMIADLNALHPYFRDKIQQLITVCARKGITIAVVESFRTKAKQAEYFGMGKKYTRSAGGKSKHQYGLACDVVALVNGVPQWDDKLLWKRIGIEGEKIGLRWGGRWKTPFDPAHFEWTGGITTMELVSGNFPTSVDNYPCLDEDIKMLRKFWEACEFEQQVIASINKKISTLANGLRP